MLDNITDYITIATYIIAIASLIVKMTANTEDDKWLKKVLSKVQPILNVLSLKPNQPNGKP